LFDINLLTSPVLGHDLISFGPRLDH
jgi:hypothetical protein